MPTSSCRTPWTPQLRWRTRRNLTTSSTYSMTLSWSPQAGSCPRTGGWDPRGACSAKILAVPSIRRTPPSPQEIPQRPSTASCSGWRASSLDAEEQPREDLAPWPARTQPARHPCGCTRSTEKDRTAPQRGSAVERDAVQLAQALHRVRHDVELVRRLVMPISPSQSTAARRANDLGDGGGPASTWRSAALLRRRSCRSRRAGARRRASAAWDRRCRPVGPVARADVEFHHRLGNIHREHRLGRPRATHRRRRRYQNIDTWTRARLHAARGEEAVEGVEVRRPSASMGTHRISAPVICHGTMFE